METKTDNSKVVAAGDGKRNIYMNNGTAQRASSNWQPPSLKIAVPQ